MQQEFYINNRQELYKNLTEGSILLSFAGQEKHKTADAKYIFFGDRNFVYLTGLNGEKPVGFILLAHKAKDEVKEYIFALPSDLMLERWNGSRLKYEEIKAISGIENIYDLEQFEGFLYRLLNTGKINTMFLDLYKHFPEQDLTIAQKFSAHWAAKFPAIKIANYHYLLRKQRTYKKPCEIEAMRKALAITKEGILAMMQASKPGMYEYEYKAHFDYALTKNNVLEPGFTSIISAGENNFCIHYFGYQGQAKDGDMILNDVGAMYDGLCCDVSRGFPCNGKFDEKQRLLYQCAYQTSEYLFSIIKPGLPMSDIDKLCHQYCAKLLVDIGLLDDPKNVSRYMWHGGSHHVGFDVHDQVEVETIEANMVFCVDVGIYVEEWGIGFRLEDNCLVTENGSENLSGAIPRSIEEIEKAMHK